MLSDFARTTGCVVVLVGHLTKEGDLAGPRLLEHLVDTVLYFEPESGGALRLVRAFKNRFGPVGELAVFEMTGRGLIPVRDASGMFLRNRRTAESGSAVTAVFTGTRPFLVEVQALVVKTQYGIPTRVVTGVDGKRVALLAAVADRKANVQISPCDVYVKIAGGLRTQDPAADLALIAALVSSQQNRALAGDLVLLGEVGLTGELRPVPQLPLRISEAAAHGFHRAVVAPADPRRRPEVPEGFELLVAHDVREALRLAFSGAGARQEGGR
jgi:DNA repair protein RadA/Sms